MYCRAIEFDFTEAGNARCYLSWLFFGGVGGLDTNQDESWNTDTIVIFG